MPTTDLEIPLPKHGVNRYGPRSEQPLLATPDALNVLPFDRYGRQRLAQRPGTGKLWNTAIGGGNPVQFLQQTAIGIEQGAVIAYGTLATEAFGYSNGALETVSASAWKTYTSAGVANASVGVNVSAGTVVSASTSGIGVLQANPLASLPDYSVQIDFRYATLSIQTSFALKFKVNTTVTDCLQVWLVATGGTGAASVRLTENTTFSPAITPDSGTASASLPAGSLVVGTTYTLRIDVTGNTYAVYLGSDLLFTGTTSKLTTKTGTRVGIEFSGVAPSTPSQAVLDNLVINGAKHSPVARQTDIVAVANGTIYMGDVGEQAVGVTGGSDVFDFDTVPSGALLFGNLYLTDGRNNLKVLDIADATVADFAATAGDETAATLGGYAIAVPWRGRLVLGRGSTDPHNFVASRVGEPTDFDYTATDPAAAFAGNASENGQIGDAITALIPFSEDRLLIGGDHTLWMVVGDPAAGGSINLISDSTGVISQRAWTKAPDGSVYFIGTTGLFRMAPGSNQPELLTDKTYNQFFAAINRETQYLSLAWDRDRHGCFLFVTPVESGTATHLFFDAREGGLWPIQYPDSHGPVCAAVYDGSDPTDRYLLMGGRTGYVQIQSDTNRRDDGTAISSHVVFGPIQPFPPVGDAIVTGIDLTTGEVASGDAASVWNMNWTVEGGKTAYEVTEGTARHMAAGSLGVPGWQNIRVPRIRGGWFSLKLSNSNDGDYFSVERLSLRVTPSGRMR